MTKPKPFSIRIFMPEGQADGLKVVEKSNWSGRGVVCPRALLMEYKTRDQSSLKSYADAVSYKKQAVGESTL